MVQVVSTFDRSGIHTVRVKCGCGLDQSVSSDEDGLQQGEKHRTDKGHSWDYPKIQVFNTYGDADFKLGYPTLESSDRTVLQ